MQEQGWEAHYLSRAQEAVRSEFIARYANFAAEPDEDGGNLDRTNDCWDADFYGEEDDNVGELERYLREPRRNRRVDVLAYWKSRMDLPGLQRMARDYFGIPGTSAESERVFSAGRDVIGDKRASLGSVMIRNLMLLKRWKQEYPQLM